MWIFVGIHELPTIEGDGEDVVNESLTERKVYNSLVVIDDKGSVTATYRKVSCLAFARSTTGLTV